MKACLAGSRSLELNGDSVSVILNEMLELFDRGCGEILIRRPMRGPRRPFEALVGMLADSLSMTVTEFVPDPGGRAMVFYRDMDMVEGADQVIAFFPEDAEMSGGTGHVVEKALDRHKPVRAYSIVDGKAVLIGSDNEDRR